VRPSSGKWGYRGAWRIKFGEFIPLTDLQVRKAHAKEKAYKLGDSAGLFLFVSPSGHEDMFTLIHAAEAGPAAPYVAGLLAGFPVLMQCAPRWAPLVLMRISTRSVRRFSQRRCP
jgi:hypothetical protein